MNIKNNIVSYKDKYISNIDSNHNSNETHNKIVNNIKKKDIDNKDNIDKNTNNTYYETDRQK